MVAKRPNFKRPVESLCLFLSLRPLPPSENRLSTIIPPCIFQKMNYFLRSQSPRTTSEPLHDPFFTHKLPLPHVSKRNVPATTHGIASKALKGLRYNPCSTLGRSQPRKEIKKDLDFASLVQKMFGVATGRNGTGNTQTKKRARWNSTPNDAAYTEDSQQNEGYKMGLSTAAATTYGEVDIDFTMEEPVIILGSIDNTQSNEEEAHCIELRVRSQIYFEDRSS